MANFVQGQTVATPDSSIEVTVSATAPLAPGKVRFQLVVVDDSGNVSDPTFADVIVVDDSKPTAVLEARAGCRSESRSSSRARARSTCRQAGSRSFAGRW